MFHPHTAPTASPCAAGGSAGGPRTSAWHVQEEEQLLGVVGCLEVGSVLLQVLLHQAGALAGAGSGGGPGSTGR